MAKMTIEERRKYQRDWYKKNKEKRAEQIRKEKVVYKEKDNLNSIIKELDNKKFLILFIKVMSEQFVREYEMGFNSKGMKMVKEFMESTFNMTISDVTKKIELEFMTKYLIKAIQNMSLEELNKIEKEDNDGE